MEPWILLILVALVLLQLYQLLRKTPDELEKVQPVLREELRQTREEGARDARSLREEVGKQQKDAGESLVNTLTKMGGDQGTRLSGLQELLDKRLHQLDKAHRIEQEKSRELLEQKLRQIQEGNEKKLEEMRKTVDEKLHETLEKRLGESFKQVSERLEAVQRGLGEMKNLASGVGDLKRVLTNVKERGTWGEYQLGAILEQILTPDQYERNVQPRGKGEVVEFAVKLPGATADGGPPVWLPIDAKFPKEDYERLVEASQQADAEGVLRSTRALAAAMRKSAKDIHDKYIEPPATTDFGIMFLPTEGLYAEILRQPGLHDELQSKYRVLVAGPTTLAAILNSLRIGFQTLAIEKRSHEVWRVLGAVKTEFAKFGDVLGKVKKQLATAANTIDQTEVRTRAMERNLREVQELPTQETVDLLTLPPAETDPGIGGEEAV